MRAAKHLWLDTVKLCDAGLPERTPPRPPQFREADHDGRFDFSTLFYDVFRSGGDVFFVGPPLFESFDVVNDFVYVEHPSGTIVKPQFSRFDRLLRGQVAVSDDTHALSVEGLRGGLPIVFSEDQTDFFAGKRVAVTISRDNDLEWIADWVSFYRQTAGLEAVLLYDNMSTRYRVDDILAVLDSAALEAAVVVRWPFKWGPLGFPVQGRRRYWDSNFCQIGMLEHARLKYLSKARSVLSLDIDELAVSKVPGKTVFEIAETDEKRYVSFLGNWVENVRDPALDGVTRRHRHFLSTATPAAPSRSKWACVPEAIPLQANWATHVLRNQRGHPIPVTQSDDIVYYHFRGVTRAWKSERDLQKTSKAAPKVIVDEGLKRVYESIGWV